jgi:hypothetical protein
VLRRREKKDEVVPPATAPPLPAYSAAPHPLLKLQRAAGNQAVQGLLETPGKTSDPYTRSFLASRFQDPGVQRTRPEDQATKDEARAFTVRDAGAYEYLTPQEREGQKLLAHELSHVVQQSGAVTPQVATPADSPVEKTPQEESKNAVKTQAEAAKNKALPAKAAAETAKEEAKAEAGKTRDDVQAPADKATPKDKAKPKDKAAEEKTEAGAVEAKPKTGKDAKAEKEPTGEAEEGGTMEASAWRSRVSRRVAGVPVPHLASGAAAPAKIQKTGQAITKAHGAARGGMGKGAQAAVPDAPAVKDPIPVEPDPVPSAAEMVKKAAEAKLPDQRIPALLTTPLQTVPTMTPPPPPPKEGEKPAEKEDPKAAGKKEAEKAKKKPEKAKKAVAKKTGETKEKEEGKPLDPLLLKDEGLPKPQPFPPMFKADLGKVLAQLLANTRKEAEAIVTETRKSAYPGGKLQSVYPDIGKDYITDVEPALNNELRAIGKEAGLVDKELDKKIEERRQELKDQEAKAKGEIVETGKEVKKDVRQEGKKKNDEAAALKKKHDKDAAKKVEAVKDANDPEVVKGQRDRQLKRTEDIVAQGSLNLKKSGDLRDALLSRNETLIINAYKRADQTDQDKIKADQAKAKADSTYKAQYGALASGESLKWLNDRIRETNAEFRRLKKEATDKTAEHTQQLLNAGAEAHKMIRRWADEKLGQHRNWWEELMDQVTDWAAQVKAQTAVWETQQNQDTRDDIARDLLQVDGLINFVGENVDLETLDKRRDLTAEQKAIIKTYLTPGPEARNPISAVAAGLRVKIAQQKRKDLVARMEKELIAKPNEEWRNLDKICQAERPGFQAGSIVSQLWNAMDQWGTDEDAVYAALAGLSTLGGATVRKAYRDTHGKDLESHIRSEFSGGEKKRAIALLEGKQAVADAAALYEAMEGGLTGWGTDEAAVYKTLRNKSPEEREAIAAEYFRISGRKLDTVLEDEMEGHELDRGKALMEGNTAKADAIGIDAAMRGGLTGWGTEESEIEEIYKNIRQEVAAAHPDWTSAQVSAEVARRNQEVEVEFNAKYAKDYGSPEGSALRKAFNEELEGPDLDLANAMADDDMVAADAARIAIEAQGVFYTSDDAVNTVLQGQYERALEDLRRDVLPGKKKKLQEEIEKRRKEGKPMTQDEIAAANRKMEREIEELAKVKGKENMTALEKRFDAKYTDWYESGETGQREHGGLRTVIKMNMSGEDQKKAGDLLEQGGYLTPVQKIDYAVTGAGTDEDLLKNALKGRTKEEIAQIRKDWEAKHPGQSMDARIKSELDGRDLFDVGELLVGEPTNAKERMEQLERRHYYEKNAYLLGNALAKHEERVMDKEYELAKERYKKLADPNSTLSVEEKNELQSDFELQANYADIAAEDFRKGVDRVTETATQIVGAVVAITVAIVITVASGGTAAPALVALAASLWGTAATMATKMLILGSAYGLEDFGVDLALGAVDAAISVATAGVGDKLLKVTKGVPPGMLARMAQGGGKVTKVLAKGMAEGVENLLQAAPNALAANVLNDKNWQGDAFKNILVGTASQTAMGVGMGIGMSAGMGKAMDLGGKALSFAGDALGKFRGPKLEAPNVETAVPKTALVEGGEKIAAKATHVQAETTGVAPEVTPDVPEVKRPSSTGDPYAHLGSPSERKAGYFEFKESNPSIEYHDYLKALDEGTISRTVDPDAAVKMEQNLRKEVLKGLPAEQRAHFDDVPVKIVSDAEFASTTRSQKGQAVLMIDDGKPVIIMRESADPKVLREEGVHLSQLLDPRTSGKVLQLDERNMARWNEMSIGEKLDLYRTKMELEIDGQERLMKGLADDLSEAADKPHLKNALEQQIKEAEETLGNLRKRLGDVDKILPEQKLRMEKGVDVPQYLEQPPRLFSKKKVVSEPGQDAPIRGQHFEEPRKKVTDSTWNDKEGHADKVFQIGNSWREVDADGIERSYRLVEVLDENGNIKDVREEIRQVDKDTKKEVDRWQQRGSESSSRGKGTEIASELLTQADLEEAAKIRAAKEASGELPPAQGKVDVAIRSQDSSGRGFDEVILKFDEQGNPKLTLVEVKDYPGRHVPLAEFTATGENLLPNLEKLKDRLRSPEATMPPPKGMGLTPLQAQAAIAAIDAKRLDVEIRLSETTKLGEEGKTNRLTPEAKKRVDAAKAEGKEIQLTDKDRIIGVIDSMKKDLKEKLGVDVPIGKPRKIDNPEHIAKAKEKVTKRDRIGERPRYYDLAGPPGKTPSNEALHHADMIFKAEKSGAIVPPAKRVGEGVFIDGNGREVTIKSLESDSHTRLDTAKAARGIVEQLKAAGADGSVILLDLPRMSRADRRRLWRHLNRLAKENPGLNIRNRVQTIRA